MAKTARARRKRVRGAAVPVLPEELVVWEILIRLPAKALLRCRAVCCSWRCLTSSADFLLAHHRRQPSLPLVIFHGKINGSSRKFVDAAVDALDLWGAPTGSERQPVLRFDDYNHYRQFTVHASCDGLLVLSLSNHRFYICNPATRQWTALPKQLIRCKVAALYQHSSSSEHRILYWKRTGFDPDVEYYVFTVGSSVEPRYIGQFKASLEPPLALHSCLHWVVSLSQEMRLLVFNTILESFRYVTIPATDNLGWENVLEMDGMLAISCIRKSQTTLDLWVLQDYDMEVWSLKYQIDLSLAELRSIVSDRMINGLVVSKAGDILVYSVFGDHVSFYCDKKGKLLRKLQWDSVLSTPTTLWFKESLVNHTFFQRQAIAWARQPRFFRGL